MSAARPDHAREIKYAMTDAAAVCERLGLMSGRGTFTRQAGGVIIRCPWHEDRTPSCSVRRGDDGTLAVKCHGCQAGGDVLSLVAVANGLSTRRDFRQVLRLAAETAGLWGLVHELDTGTVQPERSRPAPPPQQPERDYPPSAEVDRVWGEARAITEDGEGVEWVTGRGLDAELVAAGDLARVVAKDQRLPRWASYQRRSWTETGHRLIVPMRDAGGRIRSVRGCRIIDGETPKRLPPGGHKATGLVMACPLGLAMLRGDVAPAEVAIVEGEPDFLVRATRRTRRTVANLGIVSGSWSFAFAERIPRGTEAWVRTDHDQAGDRYAAEITKTLRWRGCFVKRGGCG